MLTICPSFWPFQQYQDKRGPMIIGGYRKLVNLLSKPLLASEVLLNQAVSKIIVPKDPDFVSAYVRVKTSTGESYDNGNVERVVMTFRKAFWRTNPSKPSNFFCLPNPVTASEIFLDVTATSGSGPGLPTSPCLFALFGGPEAEWLSKNPDAAIKRVLADLETMYPLRQLRPPGAQARSRGAITPM